jgi:saccharopine dehydrogenase-like NADP-dependent oxidoreductase
MGFASHAPIDVKGTQVAPVDVLMRLVKRPGNLFLAETPQSILESDLVGMMDVEVSGTRCGEQVIHIIRYTFTDGTDHHRQARLFNIYGTTMVYVALPAVVGAKMCLAGCLESGVVSADSLAPERFFAGMQERGIPFKFEEIIRKTD